MGQLLGQLLQDDLALLPAPGWELHLEELWGRSREAWPEVVVAPSTFVEAIARALRARRTEGKPLSSLSVDLYLATSILTSDPRGLERLDQLLRSLEVEKAIGSFARSGVDLADILQRVREKLLVGGTQGGCPKLESYLGQGRLADWVRAVAVRTAIDLQRQVQPGSPPAAEDRLPVDDTDPELVHLRKVHGPHLAQAMRSAFEELSDREVNLLRMHALDGLSLDAIGRIYTVNRTTAWRWIVQARENWVSRTRASLMNHLRLDERAAASLVRALQSGFQASLGRWLNERSVPA